MPIYEYQCDGCQTVFEVRQRMTDPPPKAHACGSTALHRILSATSFVLKGTGWYATDYGNRSASPAEGGEGDKAHKPGGQADKGGPEADGKAAGSKGEAGAGGKSAAASKPSAAAPAKATATGKGGSSPAST